MALFTTILGSAVLAFIANAVVAAVVSTALSVVAKALAKKPKAQTEALDFEQMVQRRLRNGQPLEVLTGRRIVAGIGAFDDAYGTKNEYGVSISILSAKPCTQFHRLFLDGEPVTLSGDPTTGQVNVSSHFLGKGDVPRVRVRVFLGHNNAGVGEYLAGKFPSKFSSGDDFGEYCLVVLDCRNTNDDFDEDNGENYIPFQGYPEFKVELSGVKICDPRIAGADYANEASYVYSDNAALIDAQYDYGWYSGNGVGRALIVGNGYPGNLMDINQVKANADYCDEEGFSCAGVLRSGSTGDQEEIWKCYNADRVEHAAKVFSVPEGKRGFAEAIDISLYPAAYISAYDADGFSTEVYNEISTVYAEPEEFYAEKDLPIYSRPEWIAADNHIPRQMSLPLMFVTDKVQAGKLEKQEIYISRHPATCTISNLPFGFLRIPVGSFVVLTGTNIDAANGRNWVVKGRGQTARGDITLTLRECADEACFAFDENTETPEPEITPPVPRPWPWWERTPYVSPEFVSGLGGHVTGILDGTQELANVNIAGRGILTNELDGVAADLGYMDYDLSGILNGTRELPEIQLTGRGPLTPELDGVATDLGYLDFDLSGILNGTRELPEIRIAGRGPLTPELDGVATDLGYLDYDVSGILDGTRELLDINLFGRNLTLGHELNDMNLNIGTLDGSVTGLNTNMIGILDGTQELADINLAGRALTLGNELTGLNNNIGTLDGSVTGLNTNMIGILNGTQELADINLAGRALTLGNELTGLNNNIGMLDGSVTGLNTNVTGIIDGTQELADINLAGRSLTLGNELNDLTTNIGTLDGSVSGLNTDLANVISGATELTEVNITGRGALTSELDGLDNTLSSVTSDVTGIKDGTLPVTDVNLAGIGSLINKDAAQDANIISNTSSSSALSISASPGYAFATTTTPNATITTAPVTFTVNNGSGSETVTYVHVSGDTFSLNNAGTLSPSFTGSPGAAGKYGIYKGVVTDGSDTAEVQISVTLEYFDPNNNY